MGLQRLSDKPRILVVKLSSLGDLFHALPAVHVVKEGLGAAIDWVTQPEYADLVRCFADVDHVRVFPRRTLLRDGRAFLRELRRVEYEYAIDFQGLLKSALVTRAARARKRIGPSYSREGARWLYDCVAGRKDKNRHAVEEGLDVARFFGLAIGDPQFPIEFPVVSPGGQAPRVALVPCSRWEAKNWPPERFAEVARRLSVEKGVSIYVLGGASDRDACGALADEVGGDVVNLCGKTSLVEMAGTLREMDLVITVDSGPMHVAAALGVPVLALFGATDPTRTGPYGSRHRVVEPVGKTRDARAFKTGDASLMEGISVEQVVEAALDMLAVQEAKSPVRGRDE